MHRTHLPNKSNLLGWTLAIAMFALSSCSTQNHVGTTWNKVNYQQAIAHQSPAADQPAAIMPEPQKQIASAPETKVAQVAETSAKPSILATAHPKKVNRAVNKIAGKISRTAARSLAAVVTPIASRTLSDKMDGSLRRVILFAGVGVILILLGSLIPVVGTVFDIIGIVLVVIALIFLIIWLLDNA
jgi:hypothetical protein